MTNDEIDTFLDRLPADGRMAGPPAAPQQRLAPASGEVVDMEQPASHRGASIIQAMEARRDKIAEHCGYGITPEKLLATFATAVTGNPDIVKCTPASLILCLTQAAAMGLDVSGRLNSAAIVPFWNKDKHVATLIVMYGGLINIATRSERISSIDAEIICRDEEIELLKGSDPKLIHRLKLTRDHTQIIGAYAVAYHKDGPPQFEFMSKAEIDRVKKGTPAWAAQYGEQAKKTVLRRLCKRLPNDAALAAALETLNNADRLDVGEPGGRAAFDSSRTVPGRMAAAIEERRAQQGDSADEAQKASSE